MSSGYRICSSSGSRWRRINSSAGLGRRIDVGYSNSNCSPMLFRLVSRYPLHDLKCGFNRLTKSSRCQSYRITQAIL